MSDYVTITLENLEQEHLCCAIADKKHQEGVQAKKEWLKMQLKNGHVFRKLKQNGKVFIEYGDLEKEYVPISGENYLYIDCFWVSGSFKEKGHGKNLLQFAIDDAKARGKSGLCVVSSAKKVPFLSDKKYVEKYGFKVVDASLPPYELLALPLKEGETPRFCDSAKKNKVEENGVVIYYHNACPYIQNCLKEIKEVCQEKQLAFHVHLIDSVEKAKEAPCFINQFAVFYNGNFVTHELLNRSRIIKFLNL